MLKLITKITAAIAVVSIALFGSANAKTLKIETHFLIFFTHFEHYILFCVRLKFYFVLEILKIVLEKIF